MTNFRDQYSHQYAHFSGSGITWAVQRLIALNILVYAAQLLVGIRFGHDQVSGGIVVEWLSFTPSRFLHWHLYQVITYQFLHSGLMHLFFNMLCLYFFGPDVERAMGSRRFYAFYLGCGVIGVLATLIPFWVLGADPAVAGASGAILGILVAFAVVDPERQFYLFPLPFPMNARALVLVFIVFQVIYSLDPSKHVSVSTHFGGMAAGYVLIKLLPMYNSWASERSRRAAKKQSDDDPLAEAVDNIFKFDSKKKR